MTHDQDSAVRAFLAEDEADRDVTSGCLVPAGARAKGVIRAKEAGVVAGIDAARRVFVCVDPTVEFDAEADDGERVEAGRVVARVHGTLRALLAAERTALNLLQRMSGIATATARCVAEVAGTRAVVLATRKTAPGLRAFDAEAVRLGGGVLHRGSLADRVLVKSNHVAAAGGLAAVVERLTGPGGPAVPVGIEVRDLDELEVVLRPGVDVVLLDNMDPALCARAVAVRDARFPDGDGPALEASGGIAPGALRDYALAGVDRISVGALTHSVRALDLSMTITGID